MFKTDISDTDSGQLSLDAWAIPTDDKKTVCPSCGKRVPRPTVDPTNTFSYEQFHTIGKLPLREGVLPDGLRGCRYGGGKLKNLQDREAMRRSKDPYSYDVSH